jgi:hypothetical protein
VFALNPLAGRLRVALNQASLRRAAATCPRLRLVPRPPSGCGGSVAHYYHFLFDLMMPLSRVLDAAAPSTTYQLQPFGPLTNAIQDVFGNAVEISPEPADAFTRVATLLGMNPRCVRWTRRDLERFRRFVMKRLTVDDVHEPDTVVLIERMPPDPYFLHTGGQDGSGTSRRSLRNHHELQDWLARAVRTPYRFLNLQLETMSLAAQVDAFSSAALVIGQHGAGLANVAWMGRGQTVVELDDASRDHFALLCHARKCRFLRYRLDAAHAVVDMPKLQEWLKRQPAVRRFFHEWAGGADAPQQTDAQDRLP